MEGGPPLSCVYMSKYKLGTYIRLALLTAMQVVLSRFVSIQTPIMKIGFGFVPIKLAGYGYGWPGGAVVAGLSDLVGAILFPSGSFFIGFTISAVLGGAVLGFFLYDKMDLRSIIFAYLAYAVVVTLGANALSISYLYGTPYLALLPKRLLQAGIMLPIQTIITYFGLRAVCKTNLFRK